MRGREVQHVSPHGYLGALEVERITVSSQTKNLDIRGFDSGRFFNLKTCGFPCPQNFPEIQTQRFLVCGLAARALPSNGGNAPARRSTSPASPGTPRSVRDALACKGVGLYVCLSVCLFPCFHVSLFLSLFQLMPLFPAVALSLFVCLCVWLFKSKQTQALCSLSRRSCANCSTTTASSALPWTRRAWWLGGSGTRWAPGTIFDLAALDCPKVRCDSPGKTQ